MRSSRKNERSSGRKRSIFVDANTIVSSLIFEGNEALLLKLGATGACRLMTSRYVMREVAQVLGRKEFGMSHEDIQWILRFVQGAVTVGEDAGREDLKRCHARLDDKKDVHVLAAFEKFKCHMLVTGDKELLRKVKGAETTKRAVEMILGES